MTHQFKAIRTNSLLLILCPPPVKAKDAVCNPNVMSVLSVIRMREQRAYRLHRLAAVMASGSGAATRHAPDVTGYY